MSSLKTLLFWGMIKVCPFKSEKPPERSGVFVGIKGFELPTFNKYILLIIIILRLILFFIIKKISHFGGLTPQLIKLNEYGILVNI